MVRFTLCFFCCYVKECWECFWFHASHGMAGYTFEETRADVVRYCVVHMRMAVLLYRGLWRYDRCQEAIGLFRRDGGWRTSVNEDL